MPIGSGLFLGGQQAGMGITYADECGGTKRVSSRLSERAAP